jgi:hypothetical protein
MCSPSGVCNADVRVELECWVWLLLFDELLQLCDLADLLESVDFILLISVDCETCRVVATVL